METINNPLGDLYILKSIFRGFATVRLSKNQRMILEFLAIKPEMTTKAGALRYIVIPTRASLEMYGQISREL